jgi:hypothetical protein
MLLLNVHDRLLFQARSLVVTAAAQSRLWVQLALPTISASYYAALRLSVGLLLGGLALGGGSALAFSRLAVGSVCLGGRGLGDFAGLDDFVLPLGVLDENSSQYSPCSSA